MKLEEDWFNRCHLKASHEQQKKDNFFVNSNFYFIPVKFGSEKLLFREILTDCLFMFWNRRNNPGYADIAAFQGFSPMAMH